MQIQTLPAPTDTPTPGVSALDEALQEGLISIATTAYPVSVTLLTSDPQDEPDVKSVIVMIADLQGDFTNASYLAKLDAHIAMKTIIEIRKRCPQWPIGFGLTTAAAKHVLERAFDKLVQAFDTKATWFRFLCELSGRLESVQTDSEQDLEALFADLDAARKRLVATPFQADEQATITPAETA